MKTLFLLLLILPLCAAAEDTTTAAETIFRLMNQRLSYMEDVALYKAQRHMAIEDRQRERLVIRKGVEKAQQLGLPLAASKQFINAQIAIAKVIQYRFRAQWLTQPNADSLSPRDLTLVVRPALITLGDQLNQALKQFHNQGGQFQDQHWQQFEQILQHPHLTSIDKIFLFQALKEISSSSP